MARGERDNLKGGHPSPTLRESRDIGEGQEDKKVPKRGRDVSRGRAVSVAAPCSCLL